MTSIISPDGSSIGGEDASSWRTTKTLVFIAASCFALIALGMKLQDNSADRLEVRVKVVEDIVQNIDHTYVRQDGRELENIRGQLQLMNAKIDNLDSLIRRQATK